jgi:hypothetical protein
MILVKTNRPYLRVKCHTYGQTERVNQCLETYLKCAVSSTPRQWVKWMSLAEICYNSSYHTTLKCSPFKALYGWDPSFGRILVMAEAENEIVKNVLLERQNFLELLK